MPQEISQFYAPTWAPATFVTVNGTPMRTTGLNDLHFDPSRCQDIRQEPYQNQMTFQPDYPYFKRWQCRAASHAARWNLAHPHVPGYRGQSPY